LTTAEFTDNCGVNHFNSLMKKLGWVFMGDSREADLKGVDGTYKLGYATIYVQIKSANLVVNSPSKKRWHWNIFSKKETLPIEFYGEKDCFLGLVGLDIIEMPYTETDLTIKGKRPIQFIEAKEPKIGVIPGDMVIKHFQKDARKSNKITLGENSRSKWSEYFDREDRENTKKLLLREFERQTKIRDGLARRTAGGC